MKRYFTEQFPHDWKKLQFVQPDSIVLEHMLKDPTALFFGGPDWHNVSSDLARISSENRERFALCLFMSVITDQALHAHFPNCFPAWQIATRFPKFGWTGFGFHNENPVKIVSVAEASGLLDVACMSALIPTFVELFAEQIRTFFLSQKLGVEPADFFRAVVSDDAFTHTAGLLLPQIKSALGQLSASSPQSH
jgi:hypothetical protein